MKRPHKNIVDNFSPLENSLNSNTLERFLEKSDLLLYKKILDLIITDLDNMESQRLSELMSKLSELYMNLNQIVIRKKREELFIKESRMSNPTKEYLTGYIKTDTLSLSKLLHGIINHKGKYINSISKT